MEHRIARVKELKEKRGFLTRVDGEEISVFKIDGNVFAIGNVCPHQHFSMLHEGEVAGFNLTCPMHGWTYDLRTGKSTNASGCVKIFPVEIKDGFATIQVTNSVPRPESLKSRT
jgi:nitrite reductase/ring-hydroxylating ferredoxin subunit